MKTLEKILWGLFAATAAGTGVVALAIAMILAWPGIIINPTVLGWVRPVIARLGYDANWTTADIKAISISPLHQRYDLGFTDLCVSKDGMKGCFRTFSLSF